MRTYGLGYWEVMDLPVQVFWILNRNIGTLQAEDDLRRFDMTRAAHSADEQAVREVRQSYVTEINRTVVVSDELDRPALDRVRAML